MGPPLAHKIKASGIAGRLTMIVPSPEPYSQLVENERGDPKWFMGGEQVPEEHAAPHEPERGRPAWGDARAPVHGAVPSAFGEIQAALRG